MAHPKTTSNKVAKLASKLLKKSRSKRVKSVSASALSQKHGKGRKSRSA